MGITNRRQHSSSHLRIVRANVQLLNKLAKLRDQLDGWYSSCALDFFKYPDKYEIELIYTCWSCGLHRPDGAMVRCHIVPHRYGGDDVPSNYVLLCDYCHEEQPDSSHPDLQMEWLENREYTSCRVHRHTMELFSRLRSILGDDDLQFAFSVFSIRTKLIWRIARYAKRRTGGITKGLRIQNQRWEDVCKLWKRRVQHISPKHLRSRAEKWNEENWSDLDAVLCSPFKLLDDETE